MNRQRHHQPNNARLENLFWFQTSLTLYALAKKVSSETLLNDDIPFELKLKSSSAFNSTSKLSSSFVARFHIKNKWLIRDSSAVVFSKSQSERAQIIRESWCLTGFSCILGFITNSSTCQSSNAAVVVAIVVSAVVVVRTVVVGGLLQSHSGHGHPRLQLFMHGHFPMSFKSSNL